MKYLFLLLPLSVSSQCVFPTDTVHADGCSYIVEVPHIMPGETVTRCYVLESESDNFHPGYVLVQTPSCGPQAYFGLSYEVFSEDCSTSMGSGTIFPVSINPTLYLPDTSVNYVACFTYTAVCELTATCPTYDFSPLPVEMLSFYGDQVGQGIELRWSTGSEHGSSHFVIRTSTDCFLWQSVGIVSAAGYSPSMTSYSAVDRSPVSGVNYYSITEVDTDGTQETFRTIAVYFAGESPTQDFLYWYSLNGQQIR